MRENKVKEGNGRKSMEEENSFEDEKKSRERLADVVDLEEDGDEDSPGTRFKFRDRRFWVDEDDSENDTNEPPLSDKPTYVQELEQRVREAETRLAEYVKAYKEEVQGEWERTKERITRDAEKSVHIEKRRILGSLLEVLDMFDMSLESARQGSGAQPLVQGIEMVRAEYEKRLFSEGMELVEAQGKKFDPRVHEAVSMEETDDPSRDGIVVKVFKNGYLLEGELVRPALVCTARMKE